jgi:N-acetyltransferase 10
MCLVVDDQLNILPLSSHTLEIEPIAAKPSEEALTSEQLELKQLKESLQDTPMVFGIVKQCKTLDQAKAVLKFVDTIAEKTLRATITLTAARGRGKSAALGLAIASAVAYGYSNIFVTSPSPENLKTLFEFVFKGFDALDYQEHADYELIQSTNPEFNNAIIRVNIFKEHRQTIQYIHPSDALKLGQAELVVIDEAAAIPLPLVKNLLGPYLVFMASTINGYEGTGRSLSLKLIQQLRQQSISFSGNNVEIRKQVQQATSGKVLHELQLNESIRYANGDIVEKWLNELLCLDCCQFNTIGSSYFIKGTGCPPPNSCELYYVNRDTLFSYHKASEIFLQRLMSLYVASHYKNTPNDLQMLSDAPAHHIFCLLAPFPNEQQISGLPEILCVVQVCLEGELSEQSVADGLQRGKRANGDLIPWTVSQQFQDNDFPKLAGGRIVRIATHPDYQSMGYGKRTMELLQEYYEGRIISLNEDGQQNENNNYEQSNQIESVQVEFYL